MTAPEFAALDREAYISLATYRRDGRAVQTPVWFARRGERLYVFTERGAGKVKRLRSGPRARVAACNVRGRVHGAWIEARGRVIDDSATERDAYAALRAKYGWQMRCVDFFSRLAGRIDQRAILELEPGRGKRMSDDLRFEIDGGVAVVTLNRPAQRNAFSGAMGEALGAAYRRCDQDDAIRAVVLTGAGDAFCVGADLSAGGETFAAPEPEGFSAAAFDPPAFAIRKPVIAAVNGHAIGLGLTIALQCDLRVLAREAKYGVVQVRRGVMPDAYAHFTLPRIVGVSRAADLLLTGRKIDAAEADRLGLASRVVPAAEVLPTALAIARDIAVHVAPLSVAVSKRLLWESSALGPAAIERKETALHRHLMGRADAIEGVLAYLERRVPGWKLSVSRDWPAWPE